MRARRAEQSGNIFEGDPARLLICPTCQKALPRAAAAGARCMKCSRPIRDERREFCRDCEEKEQAFDKAFAAFVYEKGMRESVLRMKFENRREYLDFYAAALWQESRGFLKETRPEAIIPVPMHPRKVRERGFDQCRLLADKLRTRSGIPVLRGCIVRERYTKPQKGLSGAERRKNMAGAFRVPDPSRLPKRVLLLDDIFTTGNTVNEIARVLRAGGVRQICVLTLCITREGL